MAAAKKSGKRRGTPERPGDHESPTGPRCRCGLPPDGTGGHAVGCPARRPSATPTDTPRPDLAPLLAEWQPLLRLADWNVTVRYRRHLDHCAVSFDARYKHASIAMVDPIDWPEDAAYPYDVEKHLVHELCHLHLVPLAIENGSPNHLHEEQAVESLARAFVALKRGRMAAERGEAGR